MSDIPLRTYVEQLDNLIGRKQVDEAIAHCRHILGIYPKHLDTYRMLGKALLEKGRHGDAADIFQRVLSVMPDDFISHVGMSIVREDEANLDAAIWHMERAFEAAPSNGAIQQELCRLYGRRDGVVPTKARLTRGALARMYVQGGLYLQAEAELKAALADSAERIDLLTILAEVYWQTEQPAQAAQTSASILQKLPYSLEANRILVNIFRAQGRADDAAIYRQRLEALDPYEAFADPAANGAGAARVDASKVELSRLEYVAGMEDSGSPDWLASIGAKFEEPTSARATETQPDWLTAAGEAAKAPGTGSFQPGTPDVPDWLKELGPASNASPTPETPATPAGAPDWLRDLGLGTAPLTPAAESADSGLPDWLLTATGPLPADSVPDWMLSEPGAPADAPTQPVTAPFEQGQMPGSLPAAPGAAKPMEAVTNDREQVSAAPSDDLPDWLKNELPQEAGDDLPDWLKAMAAGPLAAARAPAAAATTQPTDLAAADIPDWLKQAAPAGAAPTSPASPAAGLVPDWLQSATRDPLGTGPLPDWLKVATGELDPRKAAGIGEPRPAEAKQEQPPAEPSATIAAGTAPAQPPEQVAPVAAESAVGLPAWLAAPVTASAGAVTLLAEPVASTPSSAENRSSHEPEPTITPAATPVVGAPDAGAPAPAPSPTTEPLLVADQLRDWLKASVPIVDPDQGAPQAESTAAGEALPDWLQAATEPAPEDTTPAWLRAAPPAMPTLAPAEHVDEPELELPDWLKSLGTAAPPPDVGARPGVAERATEKSASDSGAKAESPVELPDYLQKASPEAIARAQQPFELEPEEAAPVAEAPEPATILPADIPDWLKALAPASIELALAPVPPPAPIEAEGLTGSSLDQSLNWLDELTAQPDVTPSPAAEPPSAEAPSQPELAASASSDTAAGLGGDTLGADLPPWAQTQEPGPTDTIASWLAGKHVPDWLRQPADEAPTLPAVDWEPAATEAAPPAVEPAVAALEPALDAAPGPDTTDSDATFRWLEQLAARQGAPQAELLTSPEPEAPSVPAAAIKAESITRVASEVSTEAVVARAATTEPEPPVAPAPAGEAESLPDWLRKMEAALPPQALLDTAPSKARRPTPIAPEPTIASPVEAEAKAPTPETQPVSAPLESFAAATPESADSDGDAAMRWLESLAARQGAKPEELLTTPEERSGALPAWIAAEQAAAAQADAPSAPEQAVPVQMELPAQAAEVPAAAELPSMLAPAEAAAPVVEAFITEAPVAAAPIAEALSAEPPVAEAQIAPALNAEPPVAEAPIGPALNAEAPPELMPAAAGPEASTFDEDEALRWLEGLAAQQGAKPEELLTAPADRPLETPAWITAEQFGAPAESETTATATYGAAPAEPEQEQAAAPEPEPASYLEPPEWLKSADSTGQIAAGAFEETMPRAAPDSPDFDKLARLAERLAAARHARELELEARFAEQRQQQEAARRELEEKLQAKRVTAELVSPADTQPTAAEPVAALEPPAASAPPSEPLVASSIEAPAVEPPPASERRRSRPTPRVRPQQTIPVGDVGPAAEALARGRDALSAKDYETAVTALAALVEQNQHVELVMGVLETAAATARPPVPVLRLLGDTYMRTDQLQKALDTYRLALSSL